MIEWPRAGGMVERGERVRDRKHPDETGTVFAVRDVPASEYSVGRFYVSTSSAPALYAAMPPKYTPS